MEHKLKPGGSLLPEAQAHYAAEIELDRLSQGTGQLEFVRSQEILSRYLPAPPAVVFDVGGGPGRYAYWLKLPGRCAADSAATRVCDTPIGWRRKDMWCI